MRRRPRTSARTFRIIGAAINGSGGGIGYRNQLPWKVPEDMQHFRERTSGCAVVMGRRTWESLPGKNRGLRDRLNVIITRSPMKLRVQLPPRPDIVVATSLDDALHQVDKREHMLEKHRTYIIGGASLYKEAIRSEKCEAVELTAISDWHKGLLVTPSDMDVFFPSIPEGFEFVRCETPHPAVEFQTWVNPDDAVSPEIEYLEVLRYIRDHGEQLEDRTGTGTLQEFGVTLRFGLDDPDGRIPLMTSKRVHWKSIAEEILHFVRGDPDARKLKARGVSIWDGHTSRAHLDNIGGQHIEEGSMWKAYGWQWRQVGMPYLGLEVPYSELRKALTLPVGSDERSKCLLSLRTRFPDVPWDREVPFDLEIHDQLGTVVDTLRNNPHSRRIILNAWNVGDLNEMCLPPCHTMYIFNVSRGRLNCQMTQRSWDLFLGAPFNIAGTALIVRLLCHTTGLEPGEIKIDAANAHIYSNHIEQVTKQLRQAEDGLYRFPVLEIRKRLESLDDWESLTADDLVLHDYRHHPAIRAPMAV